MLLSPDPLLLTGCAAEAILENVSAFNTDVSFPLTTKTKKKKAEERLLLLEVFLERSFEALWIYLFLQACADLPFMWEVVDPDESYYP